MTAMAAVATATMAAVMTAVAATTIAITVAAAVATIAAIAATMMAMAEGRRLVFTAHKGDTNQREKHRDTKNDDTVHPQILQLLTGTVSGNN